MINSVFFNLIVSAAIHRFFYFFTNYAYLRRSSQKIHKQKEITIDSNIHKYLFFHFSFFSCSKFWMCSFSIILFSVLFLKWIWKVFFEVTFLKSFFFKVDYFFRSHMLIALTLARICSQYTHTHTPSHTHKHTHTHKVRTCVR